ncbi:MAG: holo-ACP synthase [Candidatus Phytoplasma cynodontis]|uniref:citrate lyase holo-[acyl-carrier protein] synthase n=1 Tax='Cynodon dactylon' phytoplasma TaxID=295320 RepID=UPI001265AD35|nr:citrate lyase holo-[acyl-carrier protein] synthase ['Cynodon dactylon' phytoplasma]KAB8122029.1 citrate lyase holo-[acyl-carrier protein] synthase ['Cynodon dactylon' phytoplasma]WIA07554.1 MAG: holo-ACP synthase [Candidatus Phytoplasma cynodontis]
MIFLLKKYIKKRNKYNKHKEQNILYSREKRYLKQKQILKKYKKGLLIISLNIPGINKTKKIYKLFLKKIFYEKIIVFLKKEKIFFFYYKNEKIIKDDAGFYLNLILNKYTQRSLNKIKKKIIKLENSNEIFSLLDIDIMNIFHTKIKRSDLKINPRKCFLCNKNAKLCSFKKNHSLKKILSFLKKKIKKFLLKYK